MRIGEVARRSGVSPRMLRHYETLGLLTPDDRTSAGYREYSSADIGRIFHIEGLKRLGLSLTEVGAALADPDFDPTQMISTLVRSTRERIASEQELLDRLEALSDLHHPDGESLLHSIDLMRSLGSADVIQRHKAALGSGAGGAVPVGDLTRAVLAEDVPNAAGAIRWALARADSPDLEVLIEGSVDASVQVRLNAFLALSEIWRQLDDAEGDGRRELMRTAFRVGMSDPDEAVRALCVLVLGQSGEPEAVPALLDMAMSGEKDIEAAEVLAGFVAPGSEVGARIMTDLRRLAASEQRVIRFRVLQVLFEITGAASEELLGDFCADPDPTVAATARSMLERPVSSAGRNGAPPRRGQ